MTCKDCLFFRICCTLSEEYNLKFMFKTSPENCPDFKDKDLFVKLPCKVGEKVYNIRWWDNKKEKCTDSKGNAFYRTVQKYKITKSEFSPFSLDYAQFGKEVFLTKEEAEKALKEKNKQV